MTWRQRSRRQVAARETGRACKTYLIVIGSFFCRIPTHVSARSLTIRQRVGITDGRFLPRGCHTLAPTEQVLVQPSERVRKERSLTRRTIRRSFVSRTFDGLTRRRCRSSRWGHDALFLKVFKDRRGEFLDEFVELSLEGFAKDSKFLKLRFFAGNEGEEERSKGPSNAHVSSARQLLPQQPWRDDSLVHVHSDFTEFESRDTDNGESSESRNRSPNLVLEREPEFVSEDGRVDRIDRVESGRASERDEDFPSCEDIVSLDLDARSRECLLRLLVTDDFGCDKDGRVEDDTGESEGAPGSEKSKTVQHEEETAPSRSSDAFNLRSQAKVPMSIVQCYGRGERLT